MNSFLRVVDTAGVVRLIAVGWIVSIDVGASGVVLSLGVPDGGYPGGLVSVPITGPIDELTRQMDGLADVWGLATLPALVAREHGKVKATA